MINFDSKGVFYFFHKDISLIIYKGDSSNSKLPYRVVLYIDKSEIIRDIRRSSEVKHFVLDILHCFGYYYLTLDIFHHSEEYNLK